MNKDPRYSKMYHYKYSNHDALRNALRQYLDEPRVSLRKLSEIHGVHYAKLCRGIVAYIEPEHRRKKAVGKRNKISPTS